MKQYLFFVTFLCLFLSIGSSAKAQTTKSNIYTQNRAACLEMLKAEDQQMSSNPANLSIYIKIASLIKDGMYNHCGLNKTQILSIFSPPHRSQIEKNLGNFKDEGFLNPDLTTFNNERCDIIMNGVLEIVDMTAKQPLIVGNTWLSTIWPKILNDKPTYARCQTPRPVLVEAINKYYLYQRKNRPNSVQTPLLSSLQQTVNPQEKHLDKILDRLEQQISDERYRRHRCILPFCLNPSIFQGELQDTSDNCRWGLDEQRQKLNWLFTSFSFDSAIWNENATKAEALLQSVSSEKSLLSNCRSSAQEVQEFLFSVYMGKLIQYAPLLPRCSNDGSRCTFQQIE